jgi:micrococcal nuclease
VTYEYEATVVRWVDGDTVDLRVDLGFRMYAETRFRLNGVDTPERGQVNHDEATALCSRLAPIGADVHIVTYKADKYGRWLVEIWGEERLSVNEQLLRAKLAVAYAGGTKQVG